MLRKVFAAAAALGLLIPPKGAAAGGVQSRPRVAVVVGLQLGRLSAPTVELYRLVATRLAGQGSWSLAGDVEVQAQLPVAGLHRLGSVTAIDRHLIVQALDGSQGPGGVIQPVQLIVDTLALDGAVLVDCQASESGALRGCGVYYYDRAAARVVAAASKSFRVPIADATRWASVLVDRLIRGLEAHRTATAHATMERIAWEGAEPTSRYHLLVEVGALGTGLRGTAGGVDAVPSAVAALGAQGDTFAAALYGEYGKATAVSGYRSEVVLERSLGLGFAARSHALEAVYWDLGISLGYLRREVALATADGKIGGQRDRALRVRVFPGVTWGVVNGVEVGPALYWIRDLSLSSDADGPYADDAVTATAWGFGLRLKATGLAE